MKSIELTDKHKEQLLEMCKVLFPQYEITFGFDVDNQICLEKNQREIWFHWFEFCMTILQQTLCKKLNKSIDLWNYDLIGKLHFHTTISRSLKHPIDYLYEQFKQLTKIK